MQFTYWPNFVTLLEHPNWGKQAKCKIGQSFILGAKAFATNPDFTFSVTPNEGTLTFDWRSTPAGFFSLSIDIAPQDMAHITRTQFPVLALSAITSKGGAPISKIFGRLGVERSGISATIDSEFVPYIDGLACAFDSRNPQLPLINSDKMWLDLIIDDPPEYGIIISNLSMLVQSRVTL